jgi:hypothetical protein
MRTSVYVMQLHGGRTVLNLLMFHVIQKMKTNHFREKR